MAKKKAKTMLVRIRPKNAILLLKIQQQARIKPSTVELVNTAVELGLNSLSLDNAFAAGPQGGDHQ